MSKHRRAQAMRNKQARRELHSSINALTREEVAQIIRRVHPRAKSTRIDELAKKAVGEAHRLVSPRK